MGTRASLSFRYIAPPRARRKGHIRLAKLAIHFYRDRIAPNCTIRHPVWPIVALQRRVRFSARLAGFCRIRWHQRRARRAERASFSVFVSNPDFRVPSLRQRGERAADRAVQRRKRGHPRGPESRPGLPQRSWPSTFWSRCDPDLLDVHLSVLALFAVGDVYASLCKKGAYTSFSV